MRAQSVRGHGSLSRARIRNVLFYERTSKSQLGGKYWDKEGPVVAGAHNADSGGKNIEDTGN